MKTITINNKTYIAKEFTFGAIRRFEGNGLSLAEISGKPMTLVSAYLSYCANISLDAADDQIEQHVLGGGKLDEVLTVIGEKMAESRFFQALNREAEVVQPKENTVETTQATVGYTVVQ